MSAIGRARRWPLPGVAWVLVMALLAVVMVAAGGGDATAAPEAPGPSGYVKYYVVTSGYQGRPEDLAEIAARFLGSASRSTDIFDLNVGVVQPDGGRLTNPAVIHAGWVLTLPWDAVGPGVRYGLPPRAAAVPQPPPVTQPPPATQPPAKPARARPHQASHARTPAGACAGTPGSAGSSQNQWAMLRVAPQHAWPYSEGAGVLVAVIDSGVDASVPGLAGRVMAGEDIIDGSGRGNTDCLGSGTAMAGIIAASADPAGGAAGVAPGATILPVRVAPTRAAVSAADQASAIDAAVSAGAKVIALGSYIDPAQSAVASAIEQAARRGVVVAAAAPARSSGTSTPGGVAATAGVIWVGGISISGGPAASYRPGTVDVVAPGVDVTSLGITGTGQFAGSGTQYAAAFVAGEAALVRSRYPDLTPAQVVHRIEVTADQIGAEAPDAIFGWGLIDPGVAVTRVIAGEVRGPRPPSAAKPGRWSALRTRALVIAVALALLALLLLVLRIRRLVRPDVLPDTGADAALAVGNAAAPATVANAAAPSAVGNLPGLPPDADELAAASTAPAAPVSVPILAGAGMAEAGSAEAGWYEAGSAEAGSAEAGWYEARSADGGWSGSGSSESGSSGAGPARPAGASSASTAGRRARGQPRGPGSPGRSDHGPTGT